MGTQALGLLRGPGGAGGQSSESRDPSRVGSPASLPAARGGVPPTASCPRGRRQGVSAAPRRPGPAPTPLARRATHHAGLGADKQVRHGARVPVRFPTWALDLVPTSAPRTRALRPAARIPLLRLWPLVVPIPARPALDRSGGQSGAGARDVTCRPRAIQGPPLPWHRTGRVRVVGVALAPAAWGAKRACCAYTPLTATPPVTGSQALLVSCVAVKRAGSKRRPRRRLPISSPLHPGPPRKL